MGKKPAKTVIGQIIAKNSSNVPSPQKGHHLIRPLKVVGVGGMFRVSKGHDYLSTLLIIGHTVFLPM